MSNPPVVPGGSVASTLNLGGLDGLRTKAQADPKAAVREAAKQFETLFMQQILKSMRESSMASGMMDNEGTKMGNEMLDAQWASKLSGLPGGLSDVIASQLERQMGVTQGVGMKPASANPAPVDPLGQDAPVAIPQKAAASFVQAQQQAADAAQARTGIPATFMLAQAAHETGWGRHEPRNADGTTSYNLFGMKAGPGWTGPVTEATTTEVVAGKAVKVTQRFRAYASYAESFADYAHMIRNNPRYASVVAAGSDAHGFAQGLQRAGYATDPAYAHKLARVIDATRRVQRSLA